MNRWRGVRLVMAAGLAALILGAGLSIPAGARAPAHASRACSSYPHPGSTSAADVPSGVRQEYGVLRRPQAQSDRISLRRLGSLPESGILTGGIRLLGDVAYGGRAFMVPSLHLLGSALVPASCVPPAERALQRALLPSLHRQYATRGLCLVIVYKVRSVPACQSAPGPVASLLYGPGTPGLGIVPDGVPAIRLSFRKHRPLRAVVRHNFWVLNDPRISNPPCGLDWISRQGIVLRTIASCNSPGTD